MLMLMTRRNISPRHGLENLFHAPGLVTLRGINKVTASLRVTACTTMHGTLSAQTSALLSARAKFPPRMSPADGGTHAAAGIVAVRQRRDRAIYTNAEKNVGTALAS